jgi:hypothetical protein
MAQILVGTGLPLNPLRVGLPINHGLIHPRHNILALHHAAHLGYGPIIPAYSTIDGIALPWKK